MPGSLNDILPEPLSPESEAIILELLERKMKGGASLAVRLLRAMEERFGPEARQVVRDMAADVRIESRPNPGDPEQDLREFCADLDRRCIGTHTWERVIDEPGRIGYHYTRCMWADVFRQLGEPELGFLFCASDEPAVKSHNPQLGFRRTRVLMHGDDLCDHIFLVEEKED